MKIYIDSAEIQQVSELLATGLFSGATTNPSILHHSGYATTDRRRVVENLLSAGAAQVFAQTVRTSRQEIVVEGREIAGISNRVVVKVPATMEGFAATADLVNENIPVLITAVYHPKQAILARVAGAWGVAPYVGRISDLGHDGVAEVRRMRDILAGSGTRILAASLRNADVVCELGQLGIHSVTVSTAVIDELVRDKNVAKAVTEFSAVA